MFTSSFDIKTIDRVANTATVDIGNKVVMWNEVIYCQNGYPLCLSDVLFNSNDIERLIFFIMHEFGVSDITAFLSHLLTECASKRTPLKRHEETEKWNEMKDE